MAIEFGMIGGGVMGEALLSRLLQQQIYQAQEILVGEPLPARRQYLAQTYGIQVTPDNRLVAQAQEALLLAVKPQVFPGVAADLQSGQPASNPMIISILAGVSLPCLETNFPGLPVVRAMPNTPATVGAGITAVAWGHKMNPEQQTLARRIFAAVGEVVEVPDSLMDAVTALAGSGPGYLALVVEALSDGGVAAGLPRSIAHQLAVQTVRGTGELLQTTGMHPGELKDRVSSPGGTTIAGLAALEQAGVRGALIAGVLAAYRRAQELGQ